VERVLTIFGGRFRGRGNLCSYQCGREEGERGAAIESAGAPGFLKPPRRPLPLPSGRGEGWGEGSLAFMAPRRGKTAVAPMSPKEIGRAADTRIRRANLLVRGSAVLFAATGLVMLYGARDYIPPLEQPDPVLGLSTRALLCVAGLAHLAISGCLCATRDPVTLGLVACWAGLNYIVYLAGTAWLKVAGAIPAVVVLAWELGVSAKVIYAVWGVFIAYLVLGGLLLVVLERRRQLRLQAEAFLKGWHELHDRRTASARGEQLAGPARAPEGAKPSEETLVPDFKFSCPLCGQHIRYEARYSGRRIACPACREKIVVPDVNPDAISRARPNH
jgi:hypothetical protein